jgi:hypothetical protein
VRLPSLAQVFAPSWGRPAGSATSAGVPAAPAAPAAAAAPTYDISNLPPDATYDQAVALLQRQRDEGLASITANRQQGLSNYGFTEGPNGTLAVDPNNPFSQASLLKKSYDTNRRSTGQSMASGGQLYSGAFQNAQDLVNRNELQASDALQKAAASFLAKNTQAGKEAATNYEIAAGQAYGDRVGRFQSNPLYDPATGQLSAPGAATGASAGTPAAPPASRSSAVAGMRRRARLTGARIGRI